MKSSEYHKKIFVHIIPLTARTQSSFNIIPLTARTQSSFNIIPLTIPLTARTQRPAYYGNKTKNFTIVYENEIEHKNQLTGINIPQI